MNKFLETEYAFRIKHSKYSNKENCRNRLLQIIWLVQGFLGYLSKDKDLRANHKFIESITPNPTFILPINGDDIYDLYEDLKARERKALKLEFFTGLNLADVVELELSDFRTINDEFYFVHKKRIKTWKKRVNYLNVYDNAFYRELERYCDRNSISENEKIFPLTSMGLYNAYKRILLKNNLNPKTLPKWIRQLSFTRLEPVLGEGTDLFSLWTQHQMGVLSTHYVKKYINQYINLYPKICDAVLIGSLKQTEEKLKFLKTEIETKLDLVDTRLIEIEKKTEKDDKIDEILSILRNKTI